MLQHRSPRSASRKSATSQEEAPSRRPAASGKSQHHHLSQSARHALELLDVAPHGLTEPLLLTYGFSRKMLSGLVRSDLATSQRQTVKIGGEPVEVTCVRITTSGHEALALEAERPSERDMSAPRKPPEA